MKFSKKFIKATDKFCDFDSYVPAPYIRKSFELDFIPEKAEITICGLGFYEVYINGENITKGALAPYISNPDDLYYYDNYDISNKLKKGRNSIGIILGNGFRNSFGGFIWDFEKAECRGPLITALCLEAKGEGKSFEIEADTSFKTHSSAIIFDELRMGCYYDANLEIKGWSELDFDDSDWNFVKFAEPPKGEPKLCTVSPIVKTEEIKPIEIKHFDYLPFAYESTLEDSEPFIQTVRENVYVYDFGVNGAGVTKLKIKGKKGQKITIRHGECLQNGNFSINSVIFNRPESVDRYLEYAQKDIFICSGEEDEFVPKFTYDGFRYAYVEGLEPEQATEDALTFLVMNSDIKARAKFECSDETLNKLFEMTRRSDLSNFYYFPTDCPQREKNGWTGDASVSAEQLLLNLECSDELREWLCNIRKAQRDDGALPGIVPTGGWGFDLNGPAWDGVCVNLPYYIFKYEGNLDVFKENAEMIIKYLKYAESRRDENGLLAFGLGDWIDPNQSTNGKIASPLEFTDSAEIYDISVKASYLFDKGGLTEYAEYAKSLAGKIRDSIRKNLIDINTMTVAGDCQTSQAVAIELGLFEYSELDRARKRLLEIIHRDGDVNACGMIGLRYLFHALTNMGETELAYKIMTSEERTCYGAWIKRGATALLENFPRENGRGVCSQNHHFLGDISSWMMQEIAGIKPNPNIDNKNEFEISPRFIKQISFAEGEFETENGILRVRWERKEKETVLKISVPENVICNLKVDAETTIIEEGYYQFFI